MKKITLTFGTLLQCMAAVPALAQDAGDRYWPMLDQYCVKCHDLDGFAGGIAFDLMSPHEVPGEAETWEKVIRKLRGGMMPPPGEPRADETSSDAFVAWLENTIDSAASGHSNPGEIALHRLNRREYETAIRDLLGVNIDASLLLPRDDMSDGFDNVANVLQVSPTFIDQYINAARLISNQAVGDSALRQTIVALSPDPAQDQLNHIPGLPLGTRGGMLVEHIFPADGEYHFNISVAAQYEEYLHRVIMIVDGEQVYETFVGGPEDSLMNDQQGVDARRVLQGRFSNIRLPLTAGKHQIGMTFQATSFMEPEDLLFSLTPASAINAPRITGIQITGPFNPAGLGSTPSREKIFICYPATSEEEDSCAEQILTNLATRAYRRPVTADDMMAPLNFYRAGREREDFESGIQNGIMSILVSPNFLYRPEVPPADAQPGQTFALSGLELASRLSFFLWSSVPDPELLALGQSGELLKQEVMLAQVDRMLADPRAESLVTNFAFQWLDVAAVDEADPDLTIFPHYNRALGEAFKQEMRLFLTEIFSQDRPVLELLTADFTYLNERLAEHYGINNVRGNHFRRVKLEDESRWGLLGKGSILTVTSYPNRTAPVIRGAWILERITGTPPNAPPPDVEALQETGADGQALTVRELMVIHRADPSCNGCHGVMDPLGLALENFDAVGGWQSYDRYAREAIDASGELPDGTPLASPADLRNALVRKPELLVQTLTEKLMTFALGRTVEYHDMPRVRQIVREAANREYRLSALVKGIVSSEQFTMKQKSTTDASGQPLAATAGQ
jgi:mono/diheme cytochrome c family protein